MFHVEHNPFVLSKCFTWNIAIRPPPATIAAMTKMPRVCDYEGSDYRTRFWENQGREYEDQVERIALRRLMPPKGETLLDIGAGFGRYADEFLGYERVVLLDYSSSLLREAKERWGNDPRFIYVAANWYQMPFVDGLFNTMVQLRTIHHAENVPGLFHELARIAAPRGTYILEFANKHNLKAMARYALRQQAWSPFTREPIEFVEMNFDFHPDYIRDHLKVAQFKPGRMLTTSHYRIGFLKDNVPTELLVKLDSFAQLTGNWWQVTPSVFVHNQHPATNQPAPKNLFFACPTCRKPIEEVDNLLTCSACDTVWANEDGVYNFKTPVNQ